MISYPGLFAGRVDLGVAEDETDIFTKIHGSVILSC